MGSLPAPQATPLNEGYTMGYLVIRVGQNGQVAPLDTPYRFEPVTFGGYLVEKIIHADTNRINEQVRLIDRQHRVH